MKILALEFSSSRRSVAILESAAGAAAVLAERTASQEHGRTGLALIDEALAAAALVPADIEILALGLGPGSYTGIRSALAIAQGWKLAHDVILRGISSADVLARTAANSGKSGEVTIAIDAQRGEFYQADYRLNPVYPQGFQQTSPLRIVPATSLGPELTLAGPDIKQLAGCAELFPDAVSLAEIALACSDKNDAPEMLEPIYLRPITFVKAASPKAAFESGCSA